MKRFSLIVASLVAAALVASLLTAPLQAQSSGPKPPITDPQLGKPKKETQTANADAGTNAAGLLTQVQVQLPTQLRRRTQSRPWLT